MGEKHYRQNRRHHHPRRMGQSQPATTTRQQLRRELHPPPIRVKTEAHRQSPENADWLAVDLSNMRSLRSEEHTSELQSRGHLVCRLLLEKKKEYLHIIQA